MKIFKPKEAAALLQTSVSTLAKLRVHGGGPRYCRLGRAIRYRAEDLEAWIALSEATSTATYRPASNNSNSSELKG
jgi:excisionase family DNA binding protein